MPCCTVSRHRRRSDARTQNTMIDITPTAATKVRELLEESGKNDHALRIFVRGMSCSGPAYGMALDNEPREDDSVSEFSGVRILVDPLSAQYVEGAQVDYEIGERRVGKRVELGGA